jgi:hypothetical protein
MIGGGFIGQMHQTNKQNMDLLKKEKHKPFDKEEIFKKYRRESLIDDKTLSDAERDDLVHRLQLEEKRELKKKIVILFLSLVGTILLIGLFYITIAYRIIEFTK